MPPPVAETVPVQKPAPPRLFHWIILHSLLLLLAAAAFVAYQQLKLNGRSTQALLSLVAAGLLALAPLRALIGELFAIEDKLLHALRGIGGLIFVGLAAGGVISGEPLLNRAAMTRPARLALTPPTPLPENPRPSSVLPVPR